MFRRICGLLLVSSSVLGCGESPTDIPVVQLFPVTGIVTVDGKPVSGAHVALHSSTTAPSAAGSVAVNPNGMSDAEGKFQLTTYSVHDGAPAGVWNVTVSWADVLNPGASEPEYGKEKLPRRYQAPDQSGISIEVKPDSTEPLVVALKSR